MDARGVLDQLLQSGNQLLDHGRQRVEEKLGLPESGDTRDAMISGLETGMIAGGLLALMLGTSRGRKVTGKVIKYGSLAAAAGVAYMVYQAWQSQDPDEASGMSINDLDEEAAKGRGMLLLRVMIAAATADEQIDDRELKAIQTQLAELDLSEEAVAMLQSEFADPLTLAQLAEEVDSIATAAEVYLLSLLVIDEANPSERVYLSRLATALRLPMELVTRLESKAFA